MHPYRTPAPPPRPTRPQSTFGDDATLDWAILLVAGPRVAIAVAAGETWGAEATLAAILVAVAVIQLVRRAWNRRRGTFAP